MPMISRHRTDAISCCVACETFACRLADHLDEALERRGKNLVPIEICPGPALRRRHGLAGVIEHIPEEDVVLRRPHRVAEPRAAHGRESAGSGSPAC